MEKIYSKFVKDRRKEFQMETAMWNDNGKKVVSKKNLFLEGKKHMENIMETYAMYSATGLLCGAEIVKDKIMFEYVSGDTFERLLLNAFKEKNKEKALSLVEQYIDIVNQICSEERADTTSADKSFEVFGNVSADKLGYTNVVFDLTFDNIIFDGNSYKITDYEWRFPFAVEKEFIKFRAIFAFVMKYGGYVNKIFDFSEFYKAFGVSMDDQERYLAYNEKFIEYVYGANGYNSMLKKYEKKSIDIFNKDTISVLRLMHNRKSSNSDTYENKFFNKMQDVIESHKDYYDDYTKFYKVTRRLKDTSPYGYTESKEFYEEFSAYIDDLYGLVEYYKNESMEREKMFIEARNRQLELENKLPKNIIKKVKRKLFKK